MPFKLDFAVEASKQLADLESKEPKKHKKVLKCLAQVESNPRHSGLNSHRYEEYDDVSGEKIWESYVENKTPGAYRVFWHYGPDEGEITVLAITPHP
jgi:mRNA-degrading endonuclease RelE of RelBE toxin-antitoxin system